MKTKLAACAGALAMILAGAAAARDPVALVEDVSGAPGAGVAFMDYVYAGQVIQLGLNGKLSLSYFDSCSQETVTGGSVTVQKGASKVSGGAVTVRDLPCQGEQIYVVTATGEAGATVSRLNVVGKDQELEWTTKSARPTFVWPAGAGGQMTVTITDEDISPAEVVWSGPAANGKFAYPATAPELETGIPYRAVAKGAGAPAAGYSRLFTIDPYIDLGDTAISRVVPLR